MDTNDPIQLGRLLRDARLARGLSRQALANRAGCSIGYLQTLERGYLPAASDVLPRLLAALGVSDAGHGPVETNGASAGNAGAEKVTDGAGHHESYSG